MSEQIVKLLVHALLPLGAIALIIGILVIPYEALIKILMPLPLCLFIAYGIWRIIDPESMFERVYKLRLSKLDLLLTRLAGIVIVLCSVIGIIRMLQR
jgi:hypothetical protein